MAKDLELLRMRIKQVHGCEAVHRKSVFVHEMMDRQTLWKGIVEVFDLMGHPEAKACYAWLSEPEHGEPRIVTILERPPVDSAAKAVKAAIFFDIQPVQRYQRHHWNEYSQETAV